MNTESSIAPPAPARLFHLAVADAALTPAPMPGPGLPSRVNGLAAFYYWKDAIVVGSYAHPSGQFSIDITRQRLDGYTANFGRMRSNGVGVPILMDHAPTAAATLGWIVAVKRQNDRLMELHQFLGESARDIGLRNQVSLGIDPDYVDGKGNRYGEAIVHSAVTPVPVVPGQGAYEPLASCDHEHEIMTLSLRSGAEPISREDEEFEPGAANRSDEHLQVAAPDNAATTVLPLPPGEGRGEGTTGKNASASGIVQTISPHPDPLPEGEGTGMMGLALTALVDAASARRDLAVARGGVAPAVADELFALLVRSPGGVVNTMMLSRSGNVPTNGAPIALAVFDALARNRPVPIGEITGLQVLSRVVPGDDPALPRLQQRMIALASGSADL